jgi:hypothetical protein
MLIPSLAGKFVSHQKTGIAREATMSWAWGGVIIGVVIVALAVGIPFFMTHRRMREHHDVSDSRYYLRSRRKSRLQRRDASASQR